MSGALSELWPLQPSTRRQPACHSTPRQEHHWGNTHGLKIRPEEPGPALLRKSEPSDAASLTKCALWLLPEGTAGQTDHGVSCREEGKTIFPTEAVAESHTSSPAILCLQLLAVSRTRLAPGHRRPPPASWPRPGCGHSSLLGACTSALDFFSALRSVYFFSDVKGAWFPPPPPYTSSRGKLQSFFQVSGTAARNPATRSCYFTPVLLSPWRGLNLEEDDIRAHWRLLFHRQWAWLRFASLPNLSWHFAHSVGTWEKQGASLSVLTSHCSPFLLWVPRFRASPSPPNTPNGRLTQNKKSCCLIPSCKHRTVENIKLLAGNQVPPTGHGVCPLILGCTQRKMGKITALHASFIH